MVISRLHEQFPRDRAAGRRFTLRRVAAAAALSAALTGISVPPASAGPSAAERLSSFRSCDELRAYAAEAVRRGAIPVWQRRRASDQISDHLVVSTLPAATVASETASMTSSSETNVQEHGIDEPDTVETSGSHVFTVVGGTLRSLDAGENRPRLLDELALTERYGSPQLMLDHNNLLIIENGYGGPDAVMPGRSTVTLTKVDVSDPRRMRVVQSLTADGRYVSARGQGATMRVVIHTDAESVEVPAPGEDEPYLEGDALRAAAADHVMASASLPVPDTAVRRGAHGTYRHRWLAGCSDVEHPAEFSGLDVLSVLTLDLDRGVVPVDTDAVLTSGEDVYASQESLYVATTRWVPTAPGGWSGSQVTRIHRFAAGPRPVTTYRSSGSLRGTVLNSFAFSEKDGILRVATTERIDAEPATGTTQTESFVTALEERGPRLVRLGRVGEIGRGENVRAVRFIGDRAYVVTFRTTDPLYALNLSDPRNLRVTGELKIPGFSSYLHPIGDDLLVGIGQSADPNTGAVTGAQVSLFDVSDPARPRRLAQRDLGKYAYSPAEHDHHAFLWSPASATLAMPVVQRNVDGARGLVGFHVTRRGGFDEIGSVVHDLDGPRGVERAVVLGPRILTISASQIVSSRVRDLRRLGSLSFATPSNAADGR